MLQFMESQGVGYDLATEHQLPVSLFSLLSLVYYFYKGNICWLIKEKVSNEMAANNVRHCFTKRIS